MEIERKFLIDRIPFDLSLYERRFISQAYVSTDPVIRIRRENERYTLTVKGAGLLAREEYELELTKKQFDTLSQKIETPFLSKTRYSIPGNNGVIYELDVYDDDLLGLLTVEAEFRALDEAYGFRPPEWFGKEITEDPAYKNSTLAKLGKPI